MSWGENMKKIFLIGFMGCGKSTISAYMKEHLHLSVIDTDHYIEKKYEMEIKDIFSTYGEKTFRDYETSSIDEVNDYEVISTGGGIVEREINIKKMKNLGTIVYLHTPFTEIVNRLKNDKTRPLWNNDLIEDMEKLYQRRSKMYEAYSDVIVDTHNRNANEIVEEIIASINKA